MWQQPFFYLLGRALLCLCVASAVRFPWPSWHQGQLSKWIAQWPGLLAAGLRCCTDASLRPAALLRRGRQSASNSALRLQGARSAGPSARGGLELGRAWSCAGAAWAVASCPGHGPLAMQPTPANSQQDN